MSFRACVHHEGYIVFHELDTIDYKLLTKNTGPNVVTNLQNLLQTTLPIQDPDLLKRCKNSKKYHNDTVGGAVVTGIVHGLASGLTFGLSEAAYKKSNPRLKEKHLPVLREMMLNEIIRCGLTPNDVVVLDQYEGDNDLNGIPDLVPEYQFWVLYIKEQNKNLNFTLLQQIYKLKNDEKKNRLLAEKARIEMTGNNGVAGLAKTMSASKRMKQHTIIAEELQEQRLALEQQLNDQEQKTFINIVDNTESTTNVEEEEEIDINSPLPQNNQQPEDEEIVVQEQYVPTTGSPPTRPNNKPQKQISARPSTKVFKPTSSSPSKKVVVQQQRPQVPPPPQFNDEPTTVYYEEEIIEAPTPPPQTTVYVTTNHPGNNNYHEDQQTHATTTTSSSVQSVVSSVSSESRPTTTITTTYSTTNNSVSNKIPDPPLERVKLSTPQERRQRREQVATYSSKFDSFKKQLKHLKYTAKKYNDASSKRRLARTELINELSSWTENTPLFGQGRVSSKVPNYTMVYTKVNEAAVAAEEKFEISIINDLSKMEARVATDLDAIIKDGKESYGIVDHYERKVFSLRSQYNKLPNKDNETGRTLIKRIQRNEEKLLNAKNKHTDIENDLIRYEEVLNSSWMLLCPLLSRMFIGDMQESKEMATTLSELNNVQQKLSVLSRKKGVNTEAKNLPDVWTYITKHGPSGLTPLAAAAAATTATASSTSPQENVVTNNAQVSSSSSNPPSSNPSPSGPAQPATQPGKDTQNYYGNNNNNNNYNQNQNYNNEEDDDDREELIEALEDFNDDLEDYLEDLEDDEERVVHIHHHHYAEPDGEVGGDPPDDDEEEEDSPAAVTAPLYARGCDPPGEDTDEPDPGEFAVREEYQDGDDDDVECNDDDCLEAVEEEDDEEECDEEEEEYEEEYEEEEEEYEEQEGYREVYEDEEVEEVEEVVCYDEEEYDDGDGADYEENAVVIEQYEVEEPAYAQEFQSQQTEEYPTTCEEYVQESYDVPDYDYGGGGYDYGGAVEEEEDGGGGLIGAFFGGF